MLQAVIFDVDGVLINSVPAVEAELGQALHHYGIRLQDLKSYHHAHSIKLVLEAVARQYGVQIDFKSFAAGLVDGILSRLQGTQPDPGLVRLIAELGRRQIALAVGSSATRPSVERKLAILGLSQSFQVVVCADDVTEHKPAPDVYLQAATQLGVAPADCIVIEDNEPGVEAAQKAGAHVVGFGQYNDDPEAHFGADSHVSSWSELSYERLNTLLTKGSHAK